ncbi:hypothetical protein GEMRC1_012455 [Eukaryota sp. GEM-RC1]
MSILVGAVFRNRWTITDKLGQGAFGEIFAATDLYTRDRVAIKLEKNSSSSKGVLKLEVAILKKLQGCPFIAKYYTCGRSDDFNYVVMELLGDNLSDLRRRQANGYFSLATVAQIGIQMTSSLEILHEHGYIHRDVKPSNFAIGHRPATSGHLFIIDFGLARRFRESDGSIRPARKTAGFRGTARYASIHSHRSDDLSRRDDFWSLFYVLVELSTGSLPWKRLRDRETIGNMKQKYPAKQLLHGLPDSFRELLAHIESLTYASRPNYHLIHKILHNLLATYMLKHNLASLPSLDWQPSTATNPPYLLYPPKKRMECVHDIDDESPAHQSFYLKTRTSDRMIALVSPGSESQNSFQGQISESHSQGLKEPSSKLEDSLSVELLRSPSKQNVRLARHHKSPQHWSQAELLPISYRSSSLALIPGVSAKIQDEKPSSEETEDPPKAKGKVEELNNFIDKIDIEEVSKVKMNLKILNDLNQILMICRYKMFFKV